MNTIHLTQNDYERLSELLRSRRFTRFWSDTDAFLEGELARARIVGQESLPQDIITMHSHVCFTDADSSEKHEYWLVFPDQADTATGKVSVLSPVGSALIGYRVGDTFSVKTGPRTRKLRVEAVIQKLSQAESHD